MRTLFACAAVAGVLSLAPGAPTWAQEPPPADNAVVKPSGDAARADIKGPWDFAPPEQIVAGRDTMDFRKEGTLLAKTSREIPKVDEAALAARKLAMYSGERYYRGPVRDGAAATAAVGLPAARVRSAAGDDDEWTVRFGWLGWTLLGVLVAGVIAAWRLGWFVPFSARPQEKHAARAASARGRSRAARAHESKIELVKRGE